MRLHIALTQTPLSILNYNLFEPFPHAKGFMVIPKTSNNYREILGGNGGLCMPTVASALVAIKVLELGRDPSVSLRLTNSGDSDCFLQVFSRKIL